MILQSLNSEGFRPQLPPLYPLIYKCTAQSPLKYGGSYTVIYAVTPFVYVHFKVSLLPDFSPQFARKSMFVPVSSGRCKYRLSTAG